MRVILCYGDSNTWGFDPATQERFPPEVRWTGVLVNELGEGFRVIEEGLPGRTTVWDDPVEGLHKNGRTYLLPCLESHQPVDLVVLMLGTNDLKQRFSVPAVDIAAGAGALVELIQKSGAGTGAGAPAILLVAPPPVGRIGEWAEMFAGAAAKSQQFAETYRRVAAEAGCHFLDAGEVVVSCESDGIHLEAGQHLKLGRAVARCAREILTGQEA